MLKTTLVVKSSLLWFKLNPASLSFAINRFVSMASRAKELCLWLFSMVPWTRCKEWIAHGYLQKYLKKTVKITLLEK